MALTPRSDDPKRREELARKSREPQTFGVGRIISRAPAPPDPEKVVDPPSRLDPILEGISVLEKDNSDHFTQSGLPRIDFLEALTRIANITQEERDEAWATFQIQQETK